MVNICCSDLSCKGHGQGKQGKEEVSRLEENKGDTKADVPVRIRESHSLLKLNLLEKKTNPCVKLLSKERRCMED